MKHTEIKEVTIPFCPNHEGIFDIKVKLEWVCPICGQSRGKINKAKSYDGSKYLLCDAWTNDCGHIDKYTDCLKESINNGLNFNKGDRDEN